jgi:hypothetical protein
MESSERRRSQLRTNTPRPGGVGPRRGSSPCPARIQGTSAARAPPSSAWWRAGGSTSPTPCCAPRRREAGTRTHWSLAARRRDDATRRTAARTHAIDALSPPRLRRDRSRPRPRFLEEIDLVSESDADALGGTPRRSSDLPHGPPGPRRRTWTAASRPRQPPRLHGALAGPGRRDPPDNRASPRGCHRARRDPTFPDPRGGGPGAQEAGRRRARLTPPPGGPSSSR